MVKTFRQIFYVIISCGFSYISFSCSKSPDITGVWVGTHTVNNDSSTELLSVRPIVHIGNNKLSYRTLGFIEGMFDEIDSLTTGYEMENGSLVLQETGETIGFRYLSNDSLIAFYSNSPNQRMIFRKIESTSNLVAEQNLLKGNSFEFTGNYGTKINISFVNDLIAIEYNPEKESFEIQKWELIDFRKNYFLILNDPIGPMSMHLDSTSSKTLYLSEFSGSKSYAFEKKAQVSAIDDFLVGSWYFDGSIDSTSSLKSNLIRQNAIDTINFEESQVTYEKNEEKISSKFSIDRASQLMMLDNQPITYSSILKIARITDDELILDQYSQHGDIASSSRFKKKE